MDLRGVFPPIPTPFTEDGAVDTAGLAANCERWLTTGLRGLVVLGSNGEAPLLEDDEADRVIETARARTPASRLLIAGVARESTAGTARAARRAADLGADAVLVRTPWFFRTLLSGEALARLLTRVHGLPGLKAALDLAGYAGGDPRPPLLPAGPGAVEEIRRALEAVQPPAADAVTGAAARM